MNTIEKIRRASRVLAVALALALAGVAPGAAQENAQTPPEWFRTSIEHMTRDGGLWVADNSSRRSAEEPFDAYVLEWRASPDAASMSGRLFGVSEGRESADFWQYRQFWHPIERRAYVMQWGAGGMYAVGILTPIGEDWGTLEQTFYMTDGRTFRLGHVYRDVGADERVTEQYDILPGEGAWRLDHSLTFRRTHR